MFLVDRHFRIFKRFLFLLIPYSLLRIGFYFYHLSTYRQFTQDEIFQSLILGIRFDIAAICLLNLPVILLALIPSKNSRFVFFERFLFVVINSLGIIASLDDYELFLFMGKRLSFDLFVITGDIWDQLPQLAQYYWYFPLMGILFGVGFYFFDKKFFDLKDSRPRPVVQIVSAILLLAFTFIGIRGGLQHKSINVQSAFTQGKNELGHLVLNTPYHFLRTLKNKSQQKLKYFATDEEALNVILNQRDLRPIKEKLPRRNIVLIILESFSLEYMEQGYTPFLEELKAKSLFFPFHLANGRRSIESLPSLLCGLPALLDEPISKSIFQGNRFTCMPDLLNRLGYTSYFFHGGARGTMGFESFTLSSGFHRYFSRSDYTHQGDYDGTWGIYDGPYLKYVADELKNMKEPFLGGVFTLSSHQPYSVPAELKGKFPKGTLEIHESIGYADYALRGFFESIKNEPWFLRTTFIITADHTSKLETKKFQNVVGHYRVPLLIYRPDQAGGVRDKVTQHSDIPRTILDMVGEGGEALPATSVNILGDDTGYALNYADGREYLLISREKVVRLSKEGKLTEASYDWENGKSTSTASSEDKLLKAYLQYFMNGLINNNLSLYR